MIHKGSQFEPKFHGTSSWMNTGEIINPSTDGVYDNDGVPEEHRQAAAYASTDQSEAQSYAEKSVSQRTARPGQGELFAPVYPVEYVSENSDPMGKLARDFPTYRRDTSGFRVAGPPSSFVVNPAAETHDVTTFTSQYE